VRLAPKGLNSLGISDNGQLIRDGFRCLFFFYGEARRVGGNTRREREQETRDRPIKRKKRSEGGRPRGYARKRERRTLP